VLPATQSCLLAGHASTVPSERYAPEPALCGAPCSPVVALYQAEYDAEKRKLPGGQPEEDTMGPMDNKDAREDVGPIQVLVVGFDDGTCGGPPG
jgi:hypothetical protein